MTTEEYLKQIDRLDRMIQNKLSEIYQLKTMVCSVTVSKDGDKVKTSPDQDRLGSAVAKIVDLERETDRLVDKFIEKRQRIIEQIEGLENLDYYDVLTMKYVGKNSISEIADKMGYTSRNVFMIRNKALAEFEKKYGNEYKNL